MAAVIAFPSPFERDQLEFARSGTSTYIRSVDKACALWVEARADWRGVKLAARLRALTNDIERLAAHRPECVGDCIALPRGLAIELQLVPHLLSLMLFRAAND